MIIDHLIVIKVVRPQRGGDRELLLPPAGCGEDPSVGGWSSVMRCFCPSVRSSGCEIYDYC